jgi:hypothetical protein
VSQTADEWHAFIEAHLTQPVEREERADGETYFTGGNPGEVVVRLTRTSITVWEYAVTWDNEYSQVVTPKLVGSVRWRRISERGASKVVQALIDAARESRHAKYRICQRCGDRQPPEWMQEPDLCVSCAQRHSGAIH